MSGILDTITGGGLLPYVYCKKITLENAGKTGETNITLNLELYQSVDELSKSSWLNSLGDGSNQFLDSMFIQILQYKEYSTALKLRAKHNRPDNAGGNVNIYTAKQKIGDGCLPRDATLFEGDIRYSADISWGPNNSFENPFKFPGGVMDPDESPVYINSAIQISISSLLGNLTQKDVLLNWAAEGKIREEIIKGKAYYVIPFEHKIEAFDEQGAWNNLGFVFYTFLDVPHFFAGLDAGYEVEPEFWEDFIVEGPVNAEVIYMNGEVQQKREAFFLPNGQAWEGSVHWHGPDNPAPDGYQGDGGLSGLDPAAPYRGWMVGEKHVHGVTQPKLRLARVHNNKISDFRSSFFEENLEGYLAFGDQQKFNEDKALSDFLQAEAGAAHLLGPGGTFLCPFQKERKKYFLKGTNINKEGKLVGSSNDSEFSKLYITRDIDNNARGVFFINLRNLLENNSNLYPLLFDAPNQDESIIDPLKQQIMSSGKLLELKVYRDRVDRHVLNTKYEEYLNDGPYEEPSKLIGAISDLTGYQTPNQNDSLTEITVSYSSEKKSDPFSERYFMFTDKDVGEKSAGLYRYRVELSFKDGTYEFLYERLKDCARMRVLLDDYYDLSVSTYKKGSESDFSFDANMVAEEYKKAHFASYFQNGSFAKPEFDDAANSKFPDFKPWQQAPLLITEIFNIFGVFTVIDTGVLSILLANMLQPSTGSPRGIDYFLKLLSTCTKKLEKILGTTKINKSGSELDNSTVPDGYSFNSQLDFVISPSEETIYEDHTFDSPSELFEAVMNEDVYMDYLSIGAPMGSNFTGLRKISPDYYKDRARLDAAKFSPLALSEETFNGEKEFLEYNGTSIASNIGRGALDDSLSKTGYSYLTPSIVEYSDPSEHNKSFNFYYTAFTVFARKALPTGLSIHSNLFDDLKNYERILISLLNYNKNKQNYIDADTASPYFWKSDSGPAGTEGSISGRMETRDTYKRMIEQTGLTLHDPNQYSSFFNKEAGASKEKIGSIDIGENYPLTFDDFSDGGLLTDSYLRFYMPAMTNGMPSPAIRPYPYSTSLPNSFKYYWMHRDAAATGESSALNTLIGSAYGSYGALDGSDPTSDNDYAPLFFFNANLTAKIQVFRGSTFAKNDEDSWSLLTIGDISAAAGADPARFLCRIVLYDEKFSQEVKIPIVDKYFLLDLSAVHLNPAVPAQPIYPTAKEWERDNYERSYEFSTMTEKGIRDARARGPLRPPPGARPDPDPSRGQPRRTVPDPRGRTPGHEQDTGRQLQQFDPVHTTGYVKTGVQILPANVPDPTGPGKPVSTGPGNTGGDTPGDGTY
tara:strand:- start:8078 stop:12019 length:3942 start_codon:yes stop_codon:yes gene_type:complete